MNNSQYFSNLKKIPIHNQIFIRYRITFLYIYRWLLVATNNEWAPLLQPTKPISDGNLHPPFNAVHSIPSYPFPPPHLAAAPLRPRTKWRQLHPSRRIEISSALYLQPHQARPAAAFQIHTSPHTHTLRQELRAITIFWLENSSYLKVLLVLVHFNSL